MWMEKIIFAGDMQDLGLIQTSRYTETVTGKI
jgi:hypothetical protein